MERCNRWKMRRRSGFGQVVERPYAVGPDDVGLLFNVSEPPGTTDEIVPDRGLYWWRSKCVGGDADTQLMVLRCVGFIVVGSIRPMGKGGSAEGLRSSSRSHMDH